MKLYSQGKHRWQTGDRKWSTCRGSRSQGDWQGLNANLRSIPETIKSKLLLPDHGNQTAPLGTGATVMERPDELLLKWKRTDRNGRVRQINRTGRQYTRLASSNRNIIYAMYNIYAIPNTHALSQNGIQTFTVWRNTIINMRCHKQSFDQLSQAGRARAWGGRNSREGRHKMAAISTYLRLRKASW